MTLKLRYILPLILTLFSITDTHSKELEVKVFKYKNLKDNIEAVKQQLHDYGFIAIQGVPGYKSKKDHYIKMSRAFIALPDAIKAESTPSNAFANGWSSGIEVFNNKRDSYKGSYYISIGDQVEELRPNIWPSKKWERADEFKSAYLNLANCIYDVGKELMPLLDLNYEKLSATGRMLYYAAVPEGEDDGNPNWCGLHRDHGILTGLIPSVYEKNGEIVSKPKGTGLFIREYEINVPDDVMIFQVGEVADLVTNREIIATDHHVKKDTQGHARYAFALFLGIDETKQLFSTNVDPEYKSRFKNGMTYKQWCDASYARYKPKENA